MTILLYEFRELEDRASKHLRVWKAWHTIIYILAAVFGIVNYIFLQNTMELTDNHCMLYPRKLEFHWVHLQEITEVHNVDQIITDGPKQVGETNNKIANKNNTNTDQILKDAQNITVPKDNTKIAKRETLDYVNETTVEEKNASVIIENSTSRLMLDTSRTLFEDCEFAEYMPLVSAICGVLWASLFLMCPSGGRTSTSTGLQNGWRILTPALLFALVLVGLTGHSFTTTNGGLQAFCSGFHNLTNASTCSSANYFIERGHNASWGLGGRASALRAAAAAVWAGWACAAALMLARCLAAPDFAVRHTRVHLKDPAKKIIPLMKGTSPRRSVRSNQTSPSKKDTMSVKSEPTATTDLVTASVEHEVDSEPTSLSASPMKRDTGETIEMTYNPQEFSVER